MTNLSVIDIDGTLLVDSRLISIELGIAHEAFLKTLRKHQGKIEERFGILRFEIGEIKGRGQPEKYALLTEPQATALMTFSRNTDRVVECKLSLVEAFEKARQIIKNIQPTPMSMAELAVYSAQKLLEVERVQAEHSAKLAAVEEEKGIQNLLFILNPDTL